MPRVWREWGRTGTYVIVTWSTLGKSMTTDMTPNKYKNQVKKHIKIKENISIKGNLNKDKTKQNKKTSGRALEGIGINNPLNLSLFNFDIN